MSSRRGHCTGRPLQLRLDAHPAAVGLRWFSTLEASLANITLYDRAATGLRLVDIEPLTLEHPVTREAADLLGLAIARRR